LEKAEHILSSLGIQLAGERETYYTDHEYAASLLGLSTDELDRRFGNGRAKQEPAARETPVEEAGEAKPSIISEPWWKPPDPQLAIVTILALFLVALAAFWLLR
jgi:hypothetical protein